MIESDDSGDGKKASTFTRVHPSSTRRRRNLAADAASGTCFWEEALVGFERFIFRSKK